MSASPTVRYFDNAATSFPKPPAVAEAMHRHLTASGSPSRGIHAGARESARQVSRCRERIARLVNLRDAGGGGALALEHVVFGYNTTDALNLGVKGTLSNARSRRGPAAPLHVVSTVMEHNSILRPLHAVRERDTHVSWTLVGADPATGLVDVDELRRAIRSGETVLLCVNHASNVMGTIQDLGAIGAMAAEFGAGSDDPNGVILLVDGAQSLGHCRVDMRAAYIDLLAFPGHKGLLGPTGTGGLCIRPGVEHRLDTIREGGTGNISEQQTHPAMLPEKYEPGSHNTVGIVGLSEGVAWLLERGVDAIRAHEIALTARLFGLLGVDVHGACAAAPGLRLLGPADPGRRVGVYSFAHETLSSQEMAAMLEASFGILTRAGLHCAPLVHELAGTSPLSHPAGSGAVRLSIGPFLTVEDVDAAAHALIRVCVEHAPANARTL